MMEDNTDQPTQQLIINLQLQDANALIKGKNRVGDPPPDAEIAAKLYEQELKSLETFYTTDESARTTQEAQAEPLTAATGTVRTEDAQPDTQTDKADEANQGEKADQQDEELALADDATPAAFALKGTEEDGQVEDGQVEEDSQVKEDSQAENPKEAMHERTVSIGHA
ncbi:hypothetical protein THARTR1_03711 [Trichoderma harzianum]|uniref:Uncharacterized protein n=1 Tax=Trichoderma harzianum TaxID=5544 RepID=A0A2K0UEK1_TRIHA|nr:hypothetical protein THARTR1_03711 [Trichoderma harzianum]